MPQLTSSLNMRGYEKHTSNPSPDQGKEGKQIVVIVKLSEQILGTFSYLLILKSLL